MPLIVSPSCPFSDAHKPDLMVWLWVCFPAKKAEYSVLTSSFFPLHLNENPTLLFRHLIHGVLDDCKQIDLILRLHYNVSVSQHSWTPGVVVKPPMKTALSAPRLPLSAAELYSYFKHSCAHQHGSLCYLLGLICALE